MRWIASKFLWVRQRALLLAGQFVLALVVAATTSLLVIQLRDHEMMAADHHLSSLALILADQGERAFEAVDLVETALLERIRNENLATPDVFRERMSVLEIHTNLVASAGPLPQLEALTVIDADGNLMNTSRSWPVTTVNVRDRDYFRALKANPGLLRFLSVPVENRSTGTWTIYLARKVTSPDGTFLGLVLAALRLNYFEHLYEQVATGPDQAISMFRRDNTLLARYPHVRQSIGQTFSSDLAFRHQAETNTNVIVVRKISLVDGQEKLIAAKAMVQFPVVVNVMDSVPAILAGWRKQATYLIGAACGLEALAAALGYLMMLQIRSHRQLSDARVEAAASAAKLVVASERERADQETKAQSLRYTHMAHHDALTGLANRVLFHSKLSEAVARSQRGETSAVLYLDLDHFKTINDTLGHPVGDALLQAVTRRLEAQVRETDTIARLGGDEFAIVQMSVNQPQDATTLAERLIETLSAPYELDSQYVSTGTSIGIALLPADGKDPDQILKNADLALYRAKEDGRGRYCFFRPEMDARMQARRTLEIDLRKALTDGEFELFYQPLMNLRTNAVTGFEALVRWYHPRRGMVSPADFIPLAEEIGLLVPLGKWVLNRACCDAAAWPADIKVAVNVSVTQFASRTLVEDVRAALAASGLEAHRLELEITETVMLEDTRAILVILHELRALGVGIAMDDFGTGYSSLSYLHRFPFSKVKIDQSFVAGLGKGGDCDAIVASVINLCESLGMIVLAEGVETDDQLQRLRAGKCSEAQGYLFSRPRPANEVAGMCNALKQQEFAGAAD
jgi:diguanylate cyclase (GGDEF)-like protein